MKQKVGEKVLSRSSNKNTGYATQDRPWERFYEGIADIKNSEKLKIESAEVNEKAVVEK